MTTSEFAIQAGAGEMQLKNGNATAITLANPNAGQFMSFGNIQTGLGGFSALGYMYHASTDETAYQLNYTTNKAAGNDTGLLIAMTDTASPGTSLGLNYTVGGVNKFNVDNSGQGYFAGNVGIGTTAPANKLDVNGGLALGTYAGSAGIANGLVVSGSVGVGTTNAFTYTKMVVGGYPVDAGFGYPLLQVGDAYNANATYSIGFGLRAVGDFAPAEIGYKALSNTPGTYGALVFGTRSVTTGSVAVSERMRIDENGNVGIGTTAPATPLHVSTSTGITIGTNTNTSDGTLKIGSAKLTTNTSGDITWNTSYAGNAPADVLKFGSIAYSLGSIRSGANALALSGAFVAETINSSTVNPVLLHISGGSGTGAGDSLVFNNVSSGAGNGIGSSLFFKSNNANGNNRSLGRISSLFSNATQGSEVGDLVFITARTNDANSTTLTEAMRIQGGNVGIGTTAPTNRLHIVSDSTSTAGLMVTGGGSVGSAATGNGQILLGSTATAQGRLSYENAATANLYLDNSWNNDAGNIYLRTKSSSAPVYALTILGSGNVGIGTTAPASPLDIGGKIQLNTASASNGLYFTYNAGNTGQPNYHLMGGSAGSEGSIIMYDGSANFIINHQHSSAGMFKIQQGGVDKIVMDRSGNLGIGTTAPAYALDVKATGTGVIARFNSDNTAGCTIADGGTISCSSDRNLKKNILGLSYGLEDVMKLNPVVFNWNFDDEIKNKSLGFIAQDVEAVIPSLVTIDSNGMKSLNTIGLIPVLTKAIQEQEIKILAFINQIKDKFTTKELCLGENGNETCVTKQELDELIKFLPTTTPSSTSIPTATPEVTATPSATPLSTAEPSPTPISNEI